MLNVYSRNAPSILLIIAIIGGIRYFMTTVVYCCISCLLKSDLKAAILSESYQVQKYTNDESEYYKSKKSPKTDKIMLTQSSSDTSDIGTKPADKQDDDSDEQNG